VVVVLKLHLGRQWLSAWMVMSHSSMASSLRTRGCRTQRPRGDDADVRPHPSDADVDAGTSTRASARDNTNIGAAAVGRETQELNDNNRSECETDAEDDTAPKCRICYGTVEPSSGLRTFASPSPCDCKGSSAYVHLYCLQRCVCVCVCVCVCFCAGTTSINRIARCCRWLVGSTRSLLTLPTANRWRTVAGGAGMDECTVCGAAYRGVPDPDAGSLRWRIRTAVQATGVCAAIVRVRIHLAPCTFTGVAQWSAPQYPIFYNVYLQPQP
jgi:hypothetical protein